MIKAPLAPEDFFKTAQRPAMWLYSALRLQAAADIILIAEADQEVQYLKAVDEAGREAMAKASTSPNESATVEIACPAPNYLPAQLLYAFAIENALKGLIIARNPGYVSPRKISGVIRSHNLTELAEKAELLLSPDEAKVLTALSHIGEWVGRYPVATELEKYVNCENLYPLSLDPEMLLDPNLGHPIMRACFARMVAELTGKLPSPPIRFGVIVALPD